MQYCFNKHSESATKAAERESERQEEKSQRRKVAQPTQTGLSEMYK